MRARIPVKLDDAFYFPQGLPNNAHFYDKGTGAPDLLWKLFRDALGGVDAVRGEHFDNALKIKGVATKKLTQALFLINAQEFAPYDDATRPLLELKGPAELDWNHYRQALVRLRDMFPGCAFYEINLIAYLTSRNILKPSGKFFQVSTDIFYDGTDHWGEFESNSWVRAPGPAFGVPFGKEVPDSSARYPLDRPVRGDIVLVHQRDEGKGIGIVWRNEYQDSLSADSKLQVIWLNKNQAAVEGLHAGGRWFSGAHKSKTAFRQCAAYRGTFTLLDKLCQHDDQGKDEQTHQNTGQPLNQILYGPPGTGKTWQTVNLSLKIVDGRTEDVHDLGAFQDLTFNHEKRSGNIAMVTFHQNFAYEDFVEGIRPVLDQEQEGLRYELHQGLFQQIASAASDRPKENFVLIIDEINGNYNQS